jgi:hypothetical protein
MSEIYVTIIWIIVFWEFILSAFGGWIALQKKRDWCEGALLGFLFGPLGCVVEALLPMPTEDELAARAKRENDELAARAKWQYEERRAAVEAWNRVREIEKQVNG